MVDQTTLLALAGASSGGLSLLWNSISARQKQLEELRPKLNVSLQSDFSNGKIETHLELQNIGSAELKIRSFRLYISNSGFKENFMLGLANYNGNLFIYENRIMNKINNIDLPFEYENFIQTLVKLLGYDINRIRNVITKEIFQMLETYNNGLKEYQSKYDPYQPILFIRPYFLFLENVENYSNLKKMPSDTFPQGIDIILFDYEAYLSNAKKDENALSEFTYRLNWEKNPAWSIQNAPELMQYENTHPIHNIPIFAKREDNAILSVSPTELGFPENFAPQEKRSMLFQVSGNNIDEFQTKIVIWVTSNKSKLIVFQNEITKPYYFTATPLKWLQAIKI
ncbi:MAG: hypothetical protein ACW99A_09505 [Candidatus Kariarchaeaceae archaeon]|jgi:hypothetical protein